jgi:hypothetical protein
MKPSRSIWGSILSASSSCQNTEIAEIASENSFILNPQKRVDMFCSLTCTLLVVTGTTVTK